MQFYIVYEKNLRVYLHPTSGFKGRLPCLRSISQNQVGNSSYDQKEIQIKLTLLEFF